MSNENIDYSVVLADLEAKRAALDATISNLRRFLSGQAGSGPVSGAGPDAANATNGEIPAGAFLSKSIPEAAKLYLQIVKRKSTTREIAEALQRGGMESTSKKFQGIVHAVIYRYWKSGGDIVKLDKSTWGLASWYPTGVRATAPEKRTGKKRGRPRGKTNNPKQLTQPDLFGDPSVPGLEQQIKTLLLSDRLKTFTINEIAGALGIKAKGLPLALGRMVKKGKAQKTEGGYSAAEL